MSRITWTPDKTLKTRVVGTINEAVVARILTIDGTEYSLCYTNGLHAGFADFTTFEAAQEAAEELINAFLEKIDADFLPDDVVALIKDLRAAGKNIPGPAACARGENDRMWGRAVQRASYGTYQAPAEPSGPIADPAPKKDTP